MDGAGTDEGIRHGDPAKLARFLLYSHAPVVASDQGRRVGNWNRGQPCARRGCRGPVVGGLPAPFLCAQDTRARKKPGKAGLFVRRRRPMGPEQGGSRFPHRTSTLNLQFPLTSESDATGQMMFNACGSGRRGRRLDRPRGGSALVLADATTVTWRGTGRWRRSLHAGRRERPLRTRRRRRTLHDPRPFGRPRHRGR